MSFIKENVFVIIVVLLVIIMLVVLSYFIYGITNGFDNIGDNDSISDNVDIYTNINTDENILEVQNEGNEKADTTEKINISKLKQISDIFNNCSASEEMRAQGYAMNSIVTGNRLDIFSGGDGVDLNIEFILDKNILSAQLIYNEKDPNITAAKLLLSVIVVDCVGQYKGYPDGALSNALGKKEAMNYTVENEGAEIKLLDNGKDIIIKVDLDSDFPFLEK